MGAATAVMRLVNQLLDIYRWIGGQMEFNDSP